MPSIYYDKEDKKFWTVIFKKTVTVNRIPKDYYWYQITTLDGRKTITQSRYFDTLSHCSYQAQCYILKAKGNLLMLGNELNA